MSYTLISVSSKLSILLIFQIFIVLSIDPLASNFPFILIAIEFIEF